MNRNAQLRKIVEEVGEDLIWRPVHDFEKTRLADGVGHDIDGIDPAFTALSFKGKTVCDLGCNLGHFSFHAHEHGAEKVVGYDMEPKVIEGARKLAELHSISGVEFRVCDFAEEPADETFDMGMLIDILGKINISNGFLKSILKGLESRSRSEMLLTFRPLYHVEKHFGMSNSDFIRLYPEAVIESDHFDLLRFVQELFTPRWNLAYLSKEIEPDHQYKRTVFFERKA